MVDRTQPEARRVATLKRVGGDLALDFANTADWHDTDAPEEMLNEYEDLVIWALGAGAIDEDAAQRLRTGALRCPTTACAALNEARALREVLFRIFSAVAAAAAAAGDDLAALSEACSAAAAHRRIVHAGGNYRWSWTDDGHLHRPLWPVAIAAAELLASGPLDRVKKCEDGRCGWLFLDTSRNRSRRWCDMADCGNRAKARRYYRRHHVGGA